MQIYVYKGRAEQLQNAKIEGGCKILQPFHDTIKGKRKRENNREIEGAKERAIERYSEFAKKCICTHRASSHTIFLKFFRQF